jgi:hypothetical protein
MYRFAPSPFGQPATCWRTSSSFGGGRGTVIEVRPHPGPDVLDFTQKYIGAGVTNTIELL